MMESLRKPSHTRHSSMRKAQPSRRVTGTRHCPGSTHSPLLRVASPQTPLVHGKVSILDATTPNTQLEGLPGIVLGRRMRFSHDDVGALHLHWFTVVPRFYLQRSFDKYLVRENDRNHKVGLHVGWGYPGLFQPTSMRDPDSASDNHEHRLQASLVAATLGNAENELNVDLIAI